MIKNIIFDFDGVLVDSEILVARAFSKYLENLGITFGEKDFANLAGKKTIEVIDILSQRFVIKDQKVFYDDIMNIASNIYKKELITVNGAYEFVSKSKLKLFIGSNSIKDRIVDGLKRVGLDKYFDDDQVYSFDLVKNPKPYPDVYLKAISDNNLNKNETIIIEDSAVGVMAGVSAKVRVIGITAGGHWHAQRDKKELVDAGAITVTNNYSQISKIIENF
ncbi:HAD family phosphatase [Alphaproteobacteria bacterium]|nr:HAD family phosphatase [Alphaproteobacteria bacterium]